MNSIFLPQTIMVGRILGQYPSNQLIYRQVDEVRNTRDTSTIANTITTPILTSSPTASSVRQKRSNEISSPENVPIPPSKKPIMRVNCSRRSSVPNSFTSQPVHSRHNTFEEYNLAISPAVKASQTDPFNSWPITCYRDLNENFDFLVNSFGPVTFGYLPNDRGFDIFRPMLQIALSDPAALHALMIAPVVKKGELFGQQIPGINALWHQMEALRIVKERIGSGNVDACTSEGNIYAVMVLMGISAQWGAVSRDEFDASALNKLILYKGGLDVISRHHPVLEMSIFGMSVLNPGLLRSDLYTVNELNVSIQEGQDVKVLLYSLLGFVRGTSEIGHRARAGLANIQAAFSLGTPARALLSQAPNHPGIYAHQQQKLQKRLKLHIVLYIFSILLWASPTTIQEFIMHLQFVLSNARIWQHSLRLFQWSLGANMSRGTLMFPRQAWQSYELLCAVQCLDVQLQDDILAFYRSILTREVDLSLRPEGLMSRISSVIFSPTAEVNLCKSNG